MLFIKQKPNSIEKLNNIIKQTDNNYYFAKLENKLKQSIE